MNFIPELLLALFVPCLCICLGKGASVLLYRRDGTFGSADALITGELIIIGLAVAAHVAAVFTGQSFSRCVILFLILLGIALAAAGCLLIYGKISGEKGKKLKRLSAPAGEEKVTRAKLKNRTDQREWTDRIFIGAFLLMALAQLTFVLWNAGIYTQGDMTVETVGSFLHTDGIYLVNPMTGLGFTAGIPSRLKILCLPTLYGIFCRLSGLSPETVVTDAVPVMTFISCYAAFYCVGISLFPGSRKKQHCFIIAVVILMWVGSYMYGMDGFNLLYCGYRGVTIRNLVLIPYLISLCLRKKWKSTVLCILAEACIVWTLYGLGVCLLVAVGLYLAGRRKRDGGAS